MKRINVFTIVILVLLMSLPLFSQTYFDVAPGNGTLNKAINEHHGSVIYRLQANGWYGLTGIIENNGFPLTIVGKIPAEGQMPPIIQTGTNPDGTVFSGMFNMIGDVTLQNLFIVNANMNNALGQHLFWSSSPTPIKLTIDNCTIDPAGIYMIRWALTPHPKLFITNSQIINLGDLNSAWNGNLFDTSTEPRNGLDTLYLENNTFLSTGMLLIFNASFNADSSNFYWINHNSFILHKQQFIWAWRMNEYYVTNNLFFDYCTSPQTFQANANFPDGNMNTRFALVNQDTAYYDYVNGQLLSKRKLFVEYNSNYTDPRFLEFATTWARNHTINDDGVTPIPESYLMPLMYPPDSANVNREAAMCASDAFPYFKEGNYWDNLMGSTINTDPQFNDPRFYQIQDSLYSWTIPAVKIFIWGFSADNVSPQPAQAADWFWHADPNFGDPHTWPRVDCSYKNSELLTASIEGLPLGDLNWFPDKKAIWEEHKAEIMQHILNENTSRIYIAPTTNIKWDFTTGLHGWGAFWSINPSFANSILTLNITGQYPHMLSPDSLDLNANSFSSIRVVMKNNTNLTSAQFYWITNSDPNYDENKTTHPFPITASDSEFKEYTVNLSDNPAWKGTIRQLRYDPAHNATSGTVELKEIELIRITSVNQKKPNMAHEYSLSQNYPNPFNPTTKIEYSIPKSGIVTLKIYNSLGQEVATLVDKREDPGKYSVNFDASKLASGVYLYRIQAGNFSLTKKMIVLK